MTRARDWLWLAVAITAAGWSAYWAILSALNVPAVVYDHYSTAPLVVSVLAVLAVAGAIVAWLAWRATRWSGRRRSI